MAIRDWLDKKEIVTGVALAAVLWVCARVIPLLLALLCRTARMVATQFRDLLIKAGLTQAGAAEVLEVTARTVRRYVAGDTPAPKMAFLAIERYMQQQQRRRRRVQRRRHHHHHHKKKKRALARAVDTLIVPAAGTLSL
jgi:hypothetical protein